MKTALKIFFVAALFYFLGKKGFISVAETGKAFTRLDQIVPAMIAVLLTNLLGVVRWQWLLRAQNYHLSWGRTTQLTLIGNFFNLALPGAVSGDLVKAYYVSKETQGQRGQIFGTILFDRVAGLSALVLVSATALAIHFEAFRGTALFTGIKVMMSIAAICVVVFYTYLFLVREHHDPMLRLLRVLEKRFDRAASITRIYLGLRHYHARRVTVAAVLLVSVIIHVLVCYSGILFAHALGEQDISVWSVFVVMPLGLLVTAVPITPAGVGTGHAAFSALFHFLGSQRGADVFSLFVLTQLIGGAIGGLIYLRFRSEQPGALESALHPKEAST